MRLFLESNDAGRRSSGAVSTLACLDAGTHRLERYPLARQKSRQYLDEAVARRLADAYLTQSGRTGAVDHVHGG
jgi:hypothetical protein